jgi:hypothetical protein
VNPEDELPRHDFSILLMAWVVSGVIHAVLFCLFLFVTVNTSSAVSMETEIIQTQIDDDQPKDANLINDEIGLDPERMLNYNMKRIEDYSVPGPVLPTEPIGIKGMEEAAPMNIPPPPGMGGNSGQAGGVESKTFGLASPFGTPGGMRGIWAPGGFGGRSGSTRQQMVEEGGGNGRSEAAVAAGIKWIVQHQAPDGHWSLDGFNQHGHCNCNGFGQSNNIAATAFGLLPLLGAGQTHKNPKNDKHNIYGKQVDLGLKYLMGKQSKDGYYGGGMYAHGLATIAMCEAYGMTADPTLKASAQNAINFIRAAQSDSGGWRYEPRQGGDTSVVGWQVMALKSGQMSGLVVDDSAKPTLANASKFLNSVMTSDGSGYGYTGPTATPTMTAVGLLCRLYMGTGPRNSGIIGGVNRLSASPPPKKGQPAQNGMYYYYYATQVMHHVGEDAWKKWNEDMRDYLIEKQDVGKTPNRPHLKGSWTSAGDPHAGAGGRLMITSLSVLTLEVYYRHLPLYRKGLGNNQHMTAAN